MYHTITYFIILGVLICLAVASLCLRIKNKLRFNALSKHSKMAYEIRGKGLFDFFNPCVKGVILKKTGIKLVCINYPFKDRTMLFPFNNSVYQFGEFTTSIQQKDSTNTLTIPFDNVNTAAQWQLALAKNIPEQMKNDSGQIIYNNGNNNVYNNGNNNVIVGNSMYSSKITNKDNNNGIR